MSKYLVSLCSLLFLLAACGESSDPLAPAVAAQATASQAPEIAVPQSQTTPSPSRAGEPVHISAADPRIRYTGRMDTSDPERPAFDWPAVTIAANFEGPSLTVLLQDGQNFYNVTVDGQESVLQTRPGQTRYVVAQALSSGQHSFRMTKRTETFFGTPRFLGFELAPGHDLAPPPPVSERRIEFVGDSITAGFGNEGRSPTCAFSTATENVELTYAAMTAEALQADYVIIAISGIGIVRNYSAGEKMSTGTMLTYYDLTTTDADSKEWDFSGWVPDAVVINLGTNDFSTEPQPAGEVFLQGYTELIIKIRNRYPDAHLFAVAGPIMVDPAEDTIRSAVTQMREILDDDKVHFVKIENTLELSEVDYGCAWHPNASGHRKIADQLIARLEEEMNW